MSTTGTLWNRSCDFTGLSHHDEGMLIQAFTCPKTLTNPSANEDRLVVLPPKAFAVIDGVTDKNSISHNDHTGGQIAGILIEHVIREVVDADQHMLIPVQEFVSLINRQFLRLYEDLGLNRVVHVDPNARFAAQLALVLTDRENYRFVLIGDAGIRINGTEVHWQTTPAEEVNAHVRAAVYWLLRAKGVEEDSCLTIARSYALAGLESFESRYAPLITREEWLDLREKLHQRLSQQIPHLEPSLLETFINLGIKRQARFRNMDGPGAYAAIDGFPIPDSLIETFEYSATEVKTVELFSDGYFGLGTGPTIAEWERHFREVECSDPAKVGEFISTKGSSEGSFADDRTILIVESSCSHLKL